MAEANVKAVLTRLGITDFAAPIYTLSGGQQKRVALARALIDPADLLILDERPIISMPIPLPGWKVF